MYSLPPRPGTPEWFEMHERFDKAQKKLAAKERNKDGHLIHIYCEGARFHVLSYSTLGTHCNEPECEMNFPPHQVTPEEAEKKRREREWNDWWAEFHTNVRLGSISRKYLEGGIL